MNDKLKQALVAYLESEGKRVDTERDVNVDLYAETGSCSCDGASCKAEINYYEPDQRWLNSYEVESYDIEDFLTFIVEFEGE